MVQNNNNNNNFAKAYSQPNDKANDAYDVNDSTLSNICANFPLINITEDLILEKVNEIPNNLVSE